MEYNNVEARCSLTVPELATYQRGSVEAKLPIRLEMELHLTSFQHPCYDTVGVVQRFRKSNQPLAETPVSSKSSSIRSL